MLPLPPDDLTPGVRARAPRTVATLRAHGREAVLAALTAGLLAAPHARWVAGGAAATFAVGAALIRRRLLALLLPAAVLLTATLGIVRLAALDATELRPFIGRAVAVRAILLDAPRPQQFGGWAAPARIVAGPGRGERIVVRSRAANDAPTTSVPPKPSIGEEIVVRGRMERLTRWDSAERRRGAHAAVAAWAVVPTGGRRGGVAGFVDGVRRRAETGLSRGLDPAQAALARGMVLGQDGALDETTRDAFRASGLAHVLAASGQNVALLALLAGGAVALAGGGLRLRLAAALALVALYVPLAGAGPSIVRAGIMGGAALVAGLAGRPAARAHALLLAALLTLAINPRASADIGWQLSFAAVVAIALLASPLRRALVARRLPRLAAEAVAISVAATLGTAPLMALHFEQASVVSLPANLVAAPAVGPVVWIGTLAATLGQLGATPFGPWVGAVLALLLGFVAAVADVAASAPHATVPMTIGVPMLVAAYVVIAALFASRRVRIVVAGAAVVIVVAGVVMALHRPAPPRAPTISFLDVGQGDATLLQEGGLAVLVDTGPPDGPILRRLRAAGVRRLALLVLTHGEADHQGAAPAILGAMPVDAVLDGGATAPAASSARTQEAWRSTSAPDGHGTGTAGAVAGGGGAGTADAAPGGHGAGTADAAPEGHGAGTTNFVAGGRGGGPTATAVADAIAASGARRIVPSAGQVLRVGRFRLDVLWPPPGPVPAGADANDRAVVLLVRRAWLRLALTADAESPITLPLRLPRVDVLKVAHHGSADPGLPALLQRLRPRIAAIEVGHENTYGHPAPATLAALHAVVPTVVRTDRDGTVALTLDGDRVTVR